jgi:hypothetical protein
VTTGPEDRRPGGATGRGHFRASDADRELLIDTLKTAFVDGRLTKDELDMRAGHALTSRTYADLAAITADIPARPIETEPPPPKAARAHSRKPINGKLAAWGACMIILPAGLGAAFLTYYGGFLVMFLFAFIGFTVSSRPCSSRQ